MTRSEYLETIQGQLHQRWKRKLKLRYFSVSQEPKSKKGLSKIDKAIFRKEIKAKLGRFNHRAHRKDIVLEMDFVTADKNPPAIHTLAKNYLDLLHKPMPEIDNLRGILFRDDSQVKILMVNYRSVSSSDQKPGIFLKCQSLGYFIQDLELANRIVDNDFADADGISWALRPWEDDYVNIDNYLDNLRDLEADREFYVKDGDTKLYESLRLISLWKIQESYLEHNRLDESKLLLLLRSLTKTKTNSLPYLKEFEDHIRNTWKELQDRFLLVSNFLELGNAPNKPGEKIVFKTSLQNKLHLFRERHRLLFPLLIPISVTVIFVPPRGNVVDLDNLARYIVPFVHEIFEPPTELKVFARSKVAKNDIDKFKNRPPNSISGYQIVHLPREDSDPENGKIFFSISGDFMSYRNIWQRIDDLIDHWKEEIR